MEVPQKKDTNKTCLQVEKDTAANVKAANFTEEFPFGNPSIKLLNWK